MDIIHRPIFYLKHNDSDTGSCLLLVEPTQSTQTIRSTLSRDRSADTDYLYLLAHLHRFHLEMETAQSSKRCVLSKI
jgi:hypothetical protein